MALARPALNRSAGQMTVELAVAMPVFLAIALIVGNALVFLGDCARFDRLARDYVRVYCASPAYGHDVAGGAAELQQALQGAFDGSCYAVSATSGAAGLGHVKVSATLGYIPQIAGRPLAGTVFGVALPAIEHTCSLVIDPYRPGVVL